MIIEELIVINFKKMLLHDLVYLLIVNATQAGLYIHVLTYRQNPKLS